MLPFPEESWKVAGAAGKPTFRRKKCGKLDDNVLSDSREKIDNGNSLVRKLFNQRMLKIMVSCKLECANSALKTILVLRES